MLRLKPQKDKIFVRVGEILYGNENLKGNYAHVRTWTWIKF